MARLLFMYSLIFVLQQQNTSKPLIISFESHLSVALVQYYESYMVLSQQFSFLDKEPFENRCLN